jgi:hypothetical protein
VKAAAVASQVGINPAWVLSITDPAEQIVVAAVIDNAVEIAQRRAREGVTALAVTLGQMLFGGGGGGSV